VARNAVVLVRADSAYYGFDIIDVCRRAGARFSITARRTKPEASDRNGTRTMPDTATS
jgi:hypothetical protein